MKSFAVTLGMMAMMAGPMLAGGVQENKAASVAGRWTMTVEGGAHGVTTMGLALTQDGKKVTGTFASPHGDMPVKGEFADGTLTLATISKEADAQPITFNAKLTDDTLTGYISSAMGDMTWTATRVKDGR